MPLPRLRHARHAQHAERMGRRAPRRGRATVREARRPSGAPGVHVHVDLGVGPVELPLAAHLVPQLERVAEDHARRRAWVKAQSVP